MRDEKGMVIDNNFVSFERNEMKIRGDTKGEALSTLNGEKNWTVRLKAEDRAGLREYLDVKLVLRRNAPESDIQIQEDNILKKEGDSLLLEEGFRVIAQDIIGHKIGVEIMHEARDGQTLDMYDREGKLVSSIEEAGIRDLYGNLRRSKANK